MNKSIFLFFAFVFQCSLFSQTPTIQWQKTFGGTNEDEAAVIIQTSDGGYITAGYSFSNDGNVNGNHGAEDYWVVKLNAVGTIEWQKSLGGTDDDVATSIVQTIDGGYVVAGYTNSTDGDVTGNHGDFDLWLVRLNTTGSTLWQKTYGGTDYDLANDIALTSDGGFILAGYTQSNDGDVTINHNEGDAWIVKLDSSGIIQWQKSIGGTDSDYGKSISQTADGGYIMAGKTYSNDIDVSGNHGDSDYWVVKLNSTGAIQWQNTLGGTLEDEANSVIQAADGGYLVAGIIYTTTSNNGNISGSHGEHEYWVVKLNSSGVLQWQKPLGGTGADRGYSIVQTTDGGSIVAGSCQSFNGDVTGNNDNGSVWLVKLSSSGVIQWQKSYGGSSYEEGVSIIKTSEGGFAVAGYTYSDDGDVSGNHGDADYWILKLAPETLASSTFNQSQFSIYPNPTNAILNLQLQNKIIDRITISDITGKTLLEQNKNSSQINVESLAVGIYIIQVFSESKEYKEKFIKN